MTPLVIRLVIKMRCAIISRAGQILAYGRLFIRQQGEEGLRLDLETDNGRLLKGGLLSEEGDMTEASQVLSEQFFDMWGMSDLTLKILCASQRDEAQASLPAATGIDISLHCKSLSNACLTESGIGLGISFLISGWLW